MEKTKRKKTIYLILFVIILLQLFRIIYSFAFLKEGTHSDEEWSYGLANSYFEPYIYQNADETEYTHINEWFSSDVFKDYLTVNKDQRFSYKSVFYNQSKDLHPPLYYLILHTICSFFPEKFSFWYGFSINIVAFIFTQFFLYKLIKNMTDSDIAAISGCILYGCSTGALNTFVFVRMYALLTMFTVITSYLHSLLYKTDNFRKYLPAIFIITICGALTHHYFLVFAGLLSAVFCFYYLFSKQIRKMFIYGITLLASVGTSVAIFPATINHLFGRRGEITKFEPYWQIKLCFDYSFSELFAVHFSVYKSPAPVITLIICITIMIIAAPLVFLFRNEIWFKKFTLQLRNSFSKLLSSIKTKFHNIDIVLLALIISSFGVIIATACTISIISMTTKTDRYMFLIFPILCTSAICTLRYILKWTVSSGKIKNALLITAAVSLSISSNFESECGYLFPKDKDTIDISSTIDSSNCIYISNEFWLMTCLAKDAMNFEKIYAAQPQEDALNKIISPGNDKSVFMIINTDSYKSEISEASTSEFHNAFPEFKNQKNLLDRDKFFSIVKNLDICKELSFLGYGKIFGRTFEVYRLS